MPEVRDPAPAPGRRRGDRRHRLGLRPGGPGASAGPPACARAAGPLPAGPRGSAGCRRCPGTRGGGGGSPPSARRRPGPTGGGPARRRTPRGRRPGPGTRAPPGGSPPPRRGAGSSSPGALSAATRAAASRCVPRRAAASPPIWWRRLVCPDRAPISRPHPLRLGHGLGHEPASRRATATLLSHTLPPTERPTPSDAARAVAQVSWVPAPSPRQVLVTSPGNSCLRTPSHGAHGADPTRNPPAAERRLSERALLQGARQPVCCCGRTPPAVAGLSAPAPLRRVRTVDGVRLLDHGAAPVHRPLASGSERGRPGLHRLKPLLGIPIVGVPVADGQNPSGGTPPPEGRRGAGERG